MRDIEALKEIVIGAAVSHKSWPDNFVLNRKRNESALRNTTGIAFFIYGHCM